MSSRGVPMQRCLPIMVAALGVAGCAPGDTRAALGYAEPAEYVYVVPVDRVVVGTQEGLVKRGGTGYRVGGAGPERSILAAPGGRGLGPLLRDPDRGGGDRAR